MFCTKMRGAITFTINQYRRLQQQKYSNLNSCAHFNDHHTRHHHHHHKCRLLSRMNHNKKNFNNNYDQLLYRHRQYILIKDSVDVDVSCWLGWTWTMFLSPAGISLIKTLCTCSLLTNY